MRLLRSVDKIHFHDAGPGALSLGRQSFSYSFFPHRGDSRQARVYRRGLAFNTPFLVHPFRPGTGKTTAAKPEATDALFALSPDSIQIGAFYRDEDGGVVLRLVERGGKDTLAELKTFRPFTKAQITDLLGRPVKEVQPEKRGPAKNVLTLAFRAWEIKTLRLV